MPVEEETPVETPVPPVATSGYELIMVVGGQEVGRISLQQAEVGDTYLAIFREGYELVGRLPFSATGTSPNRLVLHDLGIDVGSATG